MQPRPIRMPDSLWEDLKAEAEERGLGTAEYVRDLLRRREAILQADTQANTQADTLPDTQERLDELEQRLGDLEDVVATEERSEPRVPNRRGESAAPSSQRTEDGESGAHSEAVAEVLDGWRPGRAPGERRQAMRAAGRAAVERLQEDGGPLQRGDFEDLWEAHPVPDQAPPSENDTYWRKSLRPALQAAIEAGLARQAEGSWEYYWVGSEPDRDDVDDDRDRDSVDAAA